MVYGQIIALYAAHCIPPGSMYCMSLSDRFVIDCYVHMHWNHLENEPPILVDDDDEDDDDDADDNDNNDNNNNVHYNDNANENKNDYDDLDN